MNQIEEGLFAVEEEMPCFPKDILFHPYLLGDTLGRAEREEAAARIITFSQQLDCWVGVTWHRLMEMMKADFELGLLWDEVRLHNSKERMRVSNAMRRYHTLSLRTLGIYAIFVSKPTAELREEPDKKVPFTIVPVEGPQAIANGIHELVERGMLRIETIGEGDETIEIVFPTPKLLLRIMEKQGIPATA